MALYGTDSRAVCAMHISVEAQTSACGPVVYSATAGHTVAPEEIAMAVRSEIGPNLGSTHSRDHASHRPLVSAFS